MRRKNIALLLLLLSQFMTLHAANPEVQTFEGELRAGFGVPLGSYHNGKGEVGMTFGIEGRYNFRHLPFDCGIMLDLSSAMREYEDISPEGYKLSQNNRTLAIAALGEYNFRRGRKINPYAGIALGVAMNDVVGDKCFPSKGTSMLFAPRIGVEFFSHLRLCTQFNLSEKATTTSALQ